MIETSSNNPDLVTTPALVSTIELEPLQQVADGLTQAGCGEFHVISEPQGNTTAGKVKIRIETPPGNSDPFWSLYNEILGQFRPSVQPPTPEAIHDLITSRIETMLEERSL